MQKICHLSVFRTRYSSLTVSVQPGLSTQAQVERLLASPAVNCLSQAQVTCPHLHSGTSQCKGTGRGGEGVHFQMFPFSQQGSYSKSKICWIQKKYNNFFHDKNLPKQQYRWLSFYPSTYPRYPSHPQLLSSLALFCAYRTEFNTECLPLWCCTFLKNRVSH